ncbi:iron hydrogenase small subunit family protein, putative (macronuclear) [Tetrahymena thermophila SB210]|uniref:Iron hydrogenase small subunit family protein, putative n=1 Tax=Tetrahymena thermophila (strain SB210) TaxID=312017 RepID=I7M6P5_TETTS|nr:iron hydrogenase small subunit family protein, putative [Tetrahymena thermophila SB210]EAR85586.2 iron hydrogenase small subunit family protein, putative [Tetrahymena thermophila SB210]|eukprot:XP_001033249.2 iron hydrogenase small subunit family protein, putative [Tetrahymena thermophila SB210]
MGGQKANNHIDKMFIMSKRMKSQAAQQIDIRQRTIAFYSKVVRPLLKSYNRGRLLGGILIFIQCMQIVSLLFSEKVIQSMEINTEKENKSLDIRDTREFLITQYAKYFRVYILLLDIICSPDDTQQIQNIYYYFGLFCMVFNLFIISFILIRYIFWVFIEYSDFVSEQENNILTGSNYSTVTTIIQQRQNSQWKISNNLISRIFQCYIQVFAITFCDFSIRVLYSEVSALFNVYADPVTKSFGLVILITTIILWLLILVNDFDYSIIENDSLAQRHNFYQYLHLLITIIYIGLRYSSLAGITQTYIYLIFQLLRMIVFYKDFPYFFNFAQQAEMLSICFIVINSLLSVVAAQINKSDFSLLFLISLPVSYKISLMLIRKKDEELLPFMQKEMKVSNLNIANRYIRKLIGLTQLSYEVYANQEKGEGVCFETLYTNHVINCEDDSCFCIKYERNFPQEKEGQSQIKKNLGAKSSNQVFFNGLSILEMHGYEFRRQFIIDYLNNLFDKFFNLSNNSAFKFNYQQYQKETSLQYINGGSHTNVGTTTSVKKMSSINALIRGNRKLNKEYLNSGAIQIRAIYVYYLMQIAKAPAKAFTQVFELRESVLKDLTSLQGKYIVQSLIYDTFESFYHFFCTPDYQNQRLALTQVIEFDYLIKQLKKSMLEGLQKKQSYYEYLYQDFINLNELVRQSETCILQKEIIEQQLIRLFDICPTHPKTFIIADLYIEYFDFKKRRIRNFVSRSKKAMNYLLRKTDRRVDLQGIKSSALFISFRSSLITKSTFSAAKMFSCQINDILNKSFNNLIPDFLVKHTNKYLQALSEEGDMLWIQLGEHFSFIKNAKGYTVPVIIRSKLDIVDGNDFGLTLYLQPSNKKKEYIICDQNFQYLDSTKNITRILSKMIQGIVRQSSLAEKNATKNYLLKKLLRQFNVRNLIPYLMCIEQYEDINDLQDYNDVLGFKDQQRRNLNNNTSILAIPVNAKQISQLGQQVRLDAYEIDKFFTTYPSDSLQFLEISFSVLRQKSYFEPEKYLYYVEIAQIRKFRKQQEINEYIIGLNENLTKLYQSPIQIPLLKTSIFYFHPQKEPTYLLQLENQQSYYIQQDSSRNDLKQQNSQTNNSDNQENLEESAERRRYDYIEEGDMAINSKNKVSTLAATILQNQQSKQDSDGQSPRQITQSFINMSHIEGGKQQAKIQNTQHLNGYEPNNTLNQYSNINIFTQQQIQGSQNNFFSPRSENVALNGHHNSETTFQNSVRDVSIQDNNAREEYYLNYLLNQTQIQQSKIPHDILSSTLNQQAQQSIQELDEKIQQSSSQNNNMRIESFTMTNSLLSPELRRPNKRGALNKNIFQNADESQIQNSISYLNGWQQKKKLIKLKGASDTKIKRLARRNVNKNLTNINVDAIEDDEDDEKQQGQLFNQYSLKDINGSNNQEDQFNNLALQNNQSEDSDYLKKKQKDILRDDSSVRTGESQFYSKKVNIFDIIINKREPAEIFYIKATGFASFFILIVLTFVLYLWLKSNFDTVWLNFTNLKIGPNAIEEYSQVLRNYELSFTPFVIMCLTKAQILPSTYRAAIQQDGANSTTQNTKSIDIIFRQLLSQSQFQDFFFDQQQETQLMLLNQRYQDGSHFTYMNATRGQSLVYLPYYLSYYYKASQEYQNPKNCINFQKLNDIYSQAFTYQNYQVYVDSLVQVSTMSQDNANTILSQTKSLLIFSVVLVEVISSIIVLVVFPVYYTIQGRKEEILKLICTFNPQLIATQIAKYRSAQLNKLFLHDDVEKLLVVRRNSQAVSSNQNTMKFLPITEKKKRTISQTNSLQRFSLKISVITFFVFILLSLNPVLNVLLMRGFFDSFTHNIQEYSLILLTKSYVSLNYLSSYFLINFPIYGFGLENRNKLYRFMDSLVQNNKDRLNDFYNIDNNFQSDRYQIDKYKSVFLTALKNDACQILQDNKNSEFQFNKLVNPDKCGEIFQGKLKQGLIITIKQMFDTISSLNDVGRTPQQNLQFYLGMYLKWVSQNNLQDLDIAYYYLRDSIDLLDKFVVNISQDYFNYLTTIQLIIFIESLVVITFIFLIIGTQFIKSLGSTIYNTTFLFTLLPIDSLIENPYVFNFLSNENRRIKAK